MDGADRESGPLQAVSRVEGIIDPLFPPQIINEGEFDQRGENESSASAHPNVYRLSTK